VNTITITIIINIFGDVVVNVVDVLGVMRGVIIIKTINRIYH
jgi:hypothetical protein